MGILVAGKHCLAEFYLCVQMYQHPLQLLGGKRRDLYFGDGNIFPLYIYSHWFCEVANLYIKRRRRWTECVGTDNFADLCFVFSPSSL